jgi:DNA-binding NtrC family response regulator
MDLDPRLVVLLAVDDPPLAGEIRRLLGAGYDLEMVPEQDRALERLSKRRFSCVVLPLGDRGDQGLNSLQYLHACHSSVPVVVLTRTGDVRSAVRALRFGAAECLPEPFAPEELHQAILQASGPPAVKEAEEIGPKEAVTFDSLVTRNPAMLRTVNLARLVSATEARLLITGETGTGKDLLARAVHEHGVRHSRPFVAVNCASVVSELAESEFFGHEKGAFTGAHRLRRGWFELAHQGTLFLDEVTCLPSEVQAKLLRVLQEGKIYRIGSEIPLRVNVRIIAATNLDVRKEVGAGRFREDLYYRLKVAEISILPLRERPDDVGVLLNHFVSVHSKRYGKASISFSAEADALLRGYAWPGNVRELENLVERLVVMSNGGGVSVEQLPAEIQLRKPAQPSLGTSGEPASLRVARQRFERDMILEALSGCGWNQSRAAVLLQVHRRTLVAKIQQYAIKPPSRIRATRLFPAVE